MIANNLSVESLKLAQELIVACSSTKLGGEARARVEQLIGDDRLNWDYIFHISERNAVMPLVSSALLGGSLDKLAPEVAETVLSRSLSHMHLNVFLTAKLIEIVKLLNSNGIPIIPFKGPLLAFQAYGDISLRRFGDLDVLVKPKDFKASVELLAANGFTPLNDVSWLTRHDLNVSDKKDIYFTNADRTVNLELHWKLSGSHFALPVEMDRLWKDAVTITLAGTKISSLSFTDLFIYLCLHGSRHGWERLGWICDINELIRSTPDMDWNAIIGEAQRIGCRKVLGLSVFLVHELFGGEVPLAVGERFSEKEVQIFSELINEITNQLFAPERSSMIIGDRYKYHLQLKERTTDRWKLHFHYIRWYTRIILTPNEADKNLFQLPSSLRGIYFITRPIRLVHNALVRPNNLHD